MKHYRIDEQIKECWRDSIRDIVEQSSAVKERAHDLIVEMVEEAGGEVELVEDAFCYVFDDRMEAHDKRINSVKVVGGHLSLVYEEDYDELLELDEKSGLVEFDEVDLAEADSYVLADNIGDE